jgi:isopentenyl-diphosphate Delta-isomerase
MNAPTDAAAREEVVLLDESGRAIGRADKAGVHGTHTPLHLAFSCYIFDETDRLLLTRRALHKRTWPGVWTNSVCGHPAPGEDLPDAVRRRARQELGLELVDLRLMLPRFRYRAVMEDGTVENEMCPVYVARTPGPVELDPDEVADSTWSAWTGVRRDVRDGNRLVSPWCVEQLLALPADPWSGPPASPADLPAAARQVSPGSR